QTAHGNWKPGLPLPPHTIFLSRDHARRHGSDAFVYNGLDPAEFVFRHRKEQWDLFLGRLHSAKGYHWAIEAAKRTGRRLIVTGDGGALADTLEELLETSASIDTRSPEKCRARAERWFTHLTMATEYVRMYQQVIAGGALPPGRTTA